VAELWADCRSVIFEAITRRFHNRRPRHGVVGIVDHCGALSVVVRVFHPVSTCGLNTDCESMMGCM
jgi:hypothetical protein